MSSTLDSYFNYLNLTLAWERMIRSNGRDAKDFFGIQMYSRNLEHNLKSLSLAIQNGQYQPIDHLNITSLKFPEHIAPKRSCRWKTQFSIKLL